MCGEGACTVVKSGDAAYGFDADAVATVFCGTETAVLLPRRNGITVFHYQGDHAVAAVLEDLISSADADKAPVLPLQPGFHGIFQKISQKYGQMDLVDEELLGKRHMGVEAYVRFCGDTGEVTEDRISVFIFTVDQSLIQLRELGEAADQLVQKGKVFLLPDRTQEQQLVTHVVAGPPRFVYPVFEIVILQFLNGEQVVFGFQLPALSLQ